MRYLALFLAISTIIAAQSIPSQTEVPNARIEGSVVSSDGTPIPRAAIRLQSDTRAADNRQAPASYTAVTDDDGKFLIENITPSPGLSLSSQKAGFVTARFGARSANSAAVPLSLDAGQSLRGLVLTMVPQAVVSGRISDSHNEPIERAQVVLLRRGYLRGLRQLVTSATTVSNDKGEFRISNLMPGRYYVMARSLAVADNDNISLPTYYPNNPDPRNAAPIDLVSGEEMRGIDLHILQSKGYSVRGKLLDKDGAGVPDTTVVPIPEAIADGTADSSGFLMRTTTRTKIDGSFELRGMTPGTHVLEMVAANGRRSIGRFTVSVTNQDVTDVTLTLPSTGITVNGELRLEGGKYEELLTMPGQIPPDPSNQAPVGPGVGLRPVGVPVTEQFPSSRLNPDGSFLLEEVSPGGYFLELPAFPGFYVKSINFGGVEVGRNVINIAGGANLEILLAKNPAKFRGSVRDEKGESQTGVLISLWPADSDSRALTNNVRVASSDRYGEFKFNDLPPGNYYAAAWEDVDSGVAQASDFVRQFSGDATKITLIESGTVSEQLKWISISKIRDAEDKLP